MTEAELKAKEKKRIQRRVNLEKRRLKATMAHLSEEEQSVPDLLIDEIAFMKVTLESLREVVVEDGVVTEMDQGKYTIERENPALKAYNVMLKQYNILIRQLEEILQHRDPSVSTDDRDLGNFIKKKQ